MKIRYILLMFCFQALALSAQSDLYNWRLGLGGGLNAFEGDLPQTDILDYTNNYHYQIQLERYLAKGFSIAIQGQSQNFTTNDLVLQQGEYNQELSNFQRALNCSTNISQTQFSIQWYADNGYFLSRRSMLAPYIYAGIGYADFNVYGDLYQPDGNQYFYQNATIYSSNPTDPSAQVIVQDGVYETFLSPLKTEGVDYENQVWYIPAGIGVKWRITDRFNLDAYGTMNWYFSDYLDDVSGIYHPDLIDNYVSNPTFLGVNNRGNPNLEDDRIWQVGMKLSVNFGQQRNSIKVNPIQASRDKYTLLQYEMDTSYSNTEKEPPVHALSDDKNDVVIIDTTYVRNIDTVRIIDSTYVLVKTEEYSDNVSASNESEENEELEPDSKKEKSDGFENTKTASSSSSSDNSLALEKIDKELSTLRNLVIGLYGAEAVGMIFNNKKKEKPEEIQSVDSLTSTDSLIMEIDSSFIEDSSFIADLSAYSDSLGNKTSGVDPYYRLQNQLTSTNILLAEVLASQSDILLKLEALTSPTAVDTILDTVYVDKIVAGNSVPNIDNVVSVYFASGGTKTDVYGNSALDQIYEVWKRQTELTLNIVGFADKTGSASKNLEMGGKRAEAISKLLLVKGIPAEKMNLSSVGDTLSPKGANPLYRKVEITFSND